MPDNRMSMMIRLLSALGLLLGLMGCRDEGELPTQYNRPMTLEGQTYLPISDSYVKADPDLMSPIAQSAEPTAQAEQEPRVEMDDTSADAAATTFAEMFTIGEFEYLPDILVPDQAEVFTASPDALRVLDEFVVAARDLRQVWADTFQNQDIRLTGTSDDRLAVKLFQLAGEVQVNDVRTFGADEAEVRLESAVRGGQPLTVTVNAHQVGQVWRIEFPDWQPPTNVNALVSELDQQLAGLSNLADRIYEQDIRDDIVAESEIDKVFAGTYQIRPVQGGQNNPSPDNSPQGNQPERNQPRNERPRSSDDMMMDSVPGTPGMLNRG